MVLWHEIGTIAIEMVEELSEDVEKELETSLLSSFKAIDGKVLLRCIAVPCL